MKMGNIKYFVIVLILLSCIVGTVSAADDISQDAITAIDDVVIADQIDDADLQTNEVNTDVSAEIDSGTDLQSDASLELSNAEEGNLRTSDTVTVTSWTQLADKANATGIDYTINLNGPITINNSDILFGNNAIIVGNDNSYITGNANGIIPFKSNNTDLSITFRNVKFQNINCQMLIQLETSGISIIDNCTFINITAGTGHDSVVYNNLGTMNMTNCTFINCTAGFGAVTNHRAGTTTGITLNVKDSKFENNSASSEPGAINNCGILTVYNSTFIRNHANLWAGAIHTHSGADTLINKSTFISNTAGWNGGALYTYSTLKVYDSVFTDNNCSTNNGGGAIGAYNYGSSYYIEIENCNFTENNNLCKLLDNTSTTSLGRGGAISVLNGGTLKVYNSRFIGNNAKIGQAICAYNYRVENGTDDLPYVQIVNNSFINHTGTNDTVYLVGTFYFKENQFCNSPQTEYDEDNDYNVPGLRGDSPSKSNSRNILGTSEENNPLNAKEMNINPDDNLDLVIFENAEEGAIFYLSSGEYERPTSVIASYNITIIGEDKDTTIIKAKRGKWTVSNAQNPKSGTLTFVNLTINPMVITFSATQYKFINCTFNNCSFDLGTGRDENYTQLNLDGSVSYIPVDVFEYSFENCDFINSKVSTNFFTIAKTAKLNVINCSFNNIEVESIVLSNANHTDNNSYPAGINIDNATFKDCSFIGVVKTQSELVGNVAVENCDDFDTVSSIVDGDYTYLNATKLKIIPVDSVLDISSSEKGAVVIALTDNSFDPIAGATIKYTVNGGDEQTDVTGEDGKFTITGLTGEVTIAVSYEGNESFNPISDSKFFNFTEETATNDTNDTHVTPTKVATKLAASKVTATYNVAKKLVITLTDKNGKKLANKKVTVKVGTISKTLKTNAKGQVSLNIASLVPKTYTATVKFAGDSSYSASTVKPKVVVKKAKVKLAAKAKTFKVKVKTKKYIVTLKNNKGKVMKKVKLTLKVGKKTYKATTNAKGKATFKITKLTKKGKYTATVKFAGNKYFKALSKKVKITVKK